MAFKKPLTLDEIDALPPHTYGPTWMKTDDGKWLLPERTLGWQIAGWTYKYLKGADGKPWRFTAEQLRFILWWYATDERGRFVYRKGVLQRLKGWGKDPLVAVMCLVEMVGPCRVKMTPFGPEFGDDGHPVGTDHPAAWVQVAAVSRDQTRNTMTLFPSLMSDLFMSTYNVKPGIELIRANGGKQRLEAVTSSFRALEGGRSTFVVMNETHHWITGNNGDKMYETINGNTTKSAGGTARYLAITNAYLPGEDSVAQSMREGYEKVLEGRAVDTGLLYDTLEAHPSTPLTPEALTIVLPKIRGDAVWLDVDSITASIQDTTISASRSRRMWLNQIVADEDALYSPDQWARLARPDEVLLPGEEVVLGFDGGKTDDDTALVAIRISDAVAFVLCHEFKPDGPAGDNWEVNRQVVDSAVHDAFRLQEVKGFYADVALWESYITEWAETYGEGLHTKSDGRNPIAWDMRQSQKRVTLAHERLMQTIFDGKVFHDGDLAMKRHVLNARRRSNNYGVSFGKESRESPRKVDIYAAFLLAHECLYDFRTRGGKTTKPRTGRGYFM